MKNFINEEQVNSFIINYNAKKNQEAFWDNYTLVLWIKDSIGYFETNGLFRNNTWGLQYRIPVNDKGLWEIPTKYVKYIR